MKWLNCEKMRMMLVGFLAVVVLSVTNARGAYFLDDFNRPDGELGNGWSSWADGTIEIKIVDNEVLIAGQQAHDWWRSGIYRRVEDETRFTFDFKVDYGFAVHIELNNGIYVDNAALPSKLVEVYGWQGGPFSYSSRTLGTWSGWTKIPGSQMIAGEYNNLML